MCYRRWRDSAEGLVLARQYRLRQARTICHCMGSRNAVLVDASARSVVALLNRLVEFLPVAQLNIGHGRLDQIIALLAHDPALGLRANCSGTHQDRDDARIAAHALAQKPPPG